GCPYACKFCVTPSTNHNQWRSRSPGNVVDEMQAWYDTYRVDEFHVEDLNPTVSDERIRDICNEILKRKLPITWKLVSGTKVETMKSKETIESMAQAGCVYISISPETGSDRLNKLMQKPVNLSLLKQSVEWMKSAGIKIQCCFILGFPGETKDDLEKTKALVKDLTKRGVDEIALFIITPVPGSAIYEQFKGYHKLSELNFSPTWRNDYAYLSRFRLMLYVRFLLWKLYFYPFKVLRQTINFFIKRFETKMEMVPFRALLLKWHSR
ncbi:MAG: radical SAM protein, partial [Elusimicrobia bacterium]|nr:radical SAM protein [Elusimicrobiota bacterium]